MQLSKSLVLTKVKQRTWGVSIFSQDELTSISFLSYCLLWIRKRDTTVSTTYSFTTDFIGFIHLHDNGRLRSWDLYGGLFGFPNDTFQSTQSFEESSVTIDGVTHAFKWRTGMKISKRPRAFWTTSKMPATEIYCSTFPKYLLRPVILKELCTPDTIHDAIRTLFANIAPYTEELTEALNDLKKCLKNSTKDK